MKPNKTRLAFAPAAALLLGVGAVSAAGTADADSPTGKADHGTMHVTDAHLERKVPGTMRACHTAPSDGCVAAGNVPFAALASRLAERPAIHGITVPGMPLGSPGTGNDPTARHDVMACGGGAGAREAAFRVGR